MRVQPLSSTNTRMCTYPYIHVFASRLCLRTYLRVHTRIYIIYRRSVYEYKYIARVLVYDYVYLRCWSRRKEPVWRRIVGSARRCCGETFPRQPRSRAARKRRFSPPSTFRIYFCSWRSFRIISCTASVSRPAATAQHNVRIVFAYARALHTCAPLLVKSPSNAYILLVFYYEYS